MASDGSRPGGSQPDGIRSGTAPFGGAEIAFPVSFELRVIYLLASGATLEADLLRILTAHGASPKQPRSLPAPGVKYGRMAIPVTFADRDSMHAAYADIGALPCVKAVL